ncbi:amino acid ABC transporter permease, partial [Helicobacter pylori]|nr:amino acid ABC transporter permease [Helicobacter pylori]
MSASHNLSLFFESLDLSKERLELLLEAFYPMLKAAF